MEPEYKELSPTISIMFREESSHGETYDFLAY